MTMRHHRANKLKRTGRASFGFISLRYLLLALVVIGALRWWYASPPLHSRGVDNSGECPLPPEVRPGDEPLQTAVPRGMAAFSLATSTLTPLAGFSVDARVLGREDYRSGPEALLSPTDLALGWQGMSDPAVLSRLSISQSSRWYHYRWSGEPPLPPREIAMSSANMHMIPATDAVAKLLSQVRADERVRIDGWLVDASLPQGGRWRSSTTREDSGARACEVVYVCAITRL
ncbi:MAG: hypothetical protein EOO54_00205 [Haliea sp.]|nr:MAG: hypothetical protein EOO54_00205 [Haliea sp.]